MDERTRNREWRHDRRMKPPRTGMPGAPHKAADEMQALARVFASASPAEEPKTPLERYGPILIWCCAGLLVIAIASFIAYLSLRPAKAREAYTHGERLANAGKYREAIAYFDQAVALDSNFTDAYYARASAYSALGEDSEVVQDLNQVLKMRPNFIEAYFRRGSLYNKLGEFQRAIEDLDKAIALKPDYAAAYELRSVAYRHLGDYPGSEADSRKAKELQSSLAEIARRPSAR